MLSVDQFVPRLMREASGGFPSIFVILGVLALLLRRKLRGE